MKIASHAKSMKLYCYEQWCAKGLLSEGSSRRNLSTAYHNLPELPTSNDHNASFYRQDKQLSTCIMITNSSNKRWEYNTPMPLLWHTLGLRLLLGLIYNFIMKKGTFSSMLSTNSILGSSTLKCQINGNK